MPADPPQIRISNPLPIDRESKKRPSPILMGLFMIGLASIVIPLGGFILSIALGWQAGLDASTFGLKIGFYSVGALLAYGFAVGTYHTILAATGLDRGRR